MSLKYPKIFVFLILFLAVATGVFVYKATPGIEFVTVCEEADINCHKTNLPYQNKQLPIEERINDLLNRMTVAEKIGQMALVEKNSVKNFNDIAKYGLGALLSGGGASPDSNTPEGWLEMANNFQSFSKKTKLGIPLLYGIDANHGNSNVPGATIFPHFIGLGATNDPDLVKEVAIATAKETAATGIYWIFSPDLDVAGDLRWGRVYETFGSSSDIASRLGKAYIEGLQSYSKKGVGMMAAAKHYVGAGSMVWGSSINKNYFIDQGNSEIEEAELRRVHLDPFKKAVEAGVKSVMVGLNSWKGEKITKSKYLINDVLKEELGFKGIVFSDWYGVYEIENSKYNSVVKAVNAGVDMVMLPFDYDGFFTNMYKALMNGDISRERVDDAVRRILRVKFEMGLFDAIDASKGGLKEIGSKENREIARRAVRKSLVLLKNNNAVPISKDMQKILVGGSAADNIGKQCGGWTVEWQGIDGNWIPGTTILNGIKNIVSRDTQVEYNLNGNFNIPDKSADIGIAVVGENPYAEGWGDNINPKLSGEDILAISNLKKKSKKIIVIIVSGRPINIKEYAKDWDAIVAAWLLGSEGEGVADVLFGDYPFYGKLPVSWDL